MSRLRPLKREEMPQFEDLFSDADRRGREVPNLLRVLARKPEILKALRELRRVTISDGKVSKELKNMVAQLSSLSALKEGGRHWNMHRTPTVDYGFCLKGKRHLVLDQDDILITEGTIVVQLGNWHAWDNRSNVAVDMAYVMMGAEFAS